MGVLLVQPLISKVLSLSSRDGWMILLSNDTQKLHHHNVRVRASPGNHELDVYQTLSLIISSLRLPLTAGHIN